MKRPPTVHPARGEAFALVLVLIVVSVLALVTVGYLASMGQERATASAFAHKARAEQSAQAGVDTAMGVLRDYLRAFPDSATVWEAQSKNPGRQPGDPDYSNDGTTLYFHAVPDANNAPDPDPTADTNAGSPAGNGPNNVKPETDPANPGADNRSVFVLPLVSGAVPLLAADRPLDVVNTGAFIDLNARRFLGDDQGWLGTPPGYAYPTAARLPRPVRVPWVEIRQRDGVTDAAAAPVVGRYAFWVEDESFRANASYANARQPPGSPRGDNASAANLPLNPTDLNLVGTLTALGDPDPAAVARGLLTTRAVYPGGLFPEGGGFAHTPGLRAATASGLRFLTTASSGGLNLSRHGTQRLNLNAVVPQSAASAAAAQTQVDQLVAALQFHAPNFSQRFYRTALSTPPAGALNAFAVPDDARQHRLIYTYKVAANLRDYIDPDPTPTIINARGYVRPDGSVDPGGKVRSGYRQSAAFRAVSRLPDGPNEVWAQGKDSAPFIEECATRFRGGPGRDADNRPTGNAARYTLAVDYYVELWNMSNRDVRAADLGPHPVVRVVNPTKWVALPGSVDLPCDDPAPAHGSPSGTRNVQPAQRDYDIDLLRNVSYQGAAVPDGVVFKAGVATVVTTDPDWAAMIAGEGASHVYLCGSFYNAPGTLYEGKRVFNGPMPTGSAGAVTTSLKMLFGQDAANPAATTVSDYVTEIVLTTDNGAVDCIQGGLPIYYNNGSNIVLTAAGGGALANTLIGGSLRGNDTASYPAVTGDPRTNNEPLEYAVFKTGSVPDSTRYFSAVANFPFTFGLPNVNAVLPAAAGSYVPWGDYYDFPAPPYAMDAASAPAVIANGALTSIGQLGDLYDPARYVPPVATANAAVNGRGGGRTFKLGQHDDRWDGDPTSASRTWASWRLADFFCVADAMEQPGLVNVNGVARDDGAALRAALTGFVFQATTSPAAGTVQPAGKTLAVDAAGPGLQAVINQIRARLATPWTAPPGTYSNPRAPTDRLFVGSANDATGSGPFFERGELGELPAFGRNATLPDGTMAPAATAAIDLVAGVNMATVFDRGREELFRRLVELTTTRGSVFTVYALGQSLVPAAANGTAPRQVAGTQQLRVTFKLVPKDAGGADFYPAADPDFTHRFAKPHHYDVQVLSATSGAR